MSDQDAIDRGMAAVRQLARSSRAYAELMADPEDATMSDTERIQTLGGHARSALMKAGVTTDSEAALLTDDQLVVSAHPLGPGAYAEIRRVFPNPEPTREDALVAERDALLAYARWLEDYYTSDYSSTAESSDELRARIRAEHGVAEIMAREDR